MVQQQRRTSRPLKRGSLPHPIVVVGSTPRDSRLPGVAERAGVPRGVSRRIGDRATVRADLIYRGFHDFYDWRTDRTTGTVTDKLGRQFDLTLIENTDRLTRQYAGLSAQGTYRAAPSLNLGAILHVVAHVGELRRRRKQWPRSRCRACSIRSTSKRPGTFRKGIVDRPASSRTALGDLRRAGNPRSAGEPPATLEIGVPYGAVATGGVNPQSYVSNPGYLSPPSAVTYYLTPRDAFRTEGQRRTDLAANYAFAISGRSKVELFGQFQVLNVFNQSQLCGCGQAVIQNGGAVSAARIDQTVSDPSAIQPVHDRSGRGGAMDEGTELRPGVEPAGVHVAPRLSGLVRREILIQRVRPAPPSARSPRTDTPTR